MRFPKLILRSAFVLCALAVAGFAQSLTLPAPSNFQSSYNDGQSVYFYFSNIQGGTGNYFLTLTSGTLPPGLTIANNSAASASGVPSVSGTIGGSGSYTFTLVAHDTTAPTPNSSNAQTLTINVVTPAVTITPATGPFTFTAGNNVSGFSLGTIMGGTGAGFTVAVTQGSVPPGLTLSVVGGSVINLAGAPLTPGTYPITIVVSDNNAPPDQSPPQAYTLQVTENLLQILPANLPGLTTQTTVGSVVNTFTPLSPYPVGGVPPYTWTLTGTPPPGLTFVPQSPSPFVADASVFTGTPTAAGTFSYTLQLADSGNTAPVSKTYTSSIISPITFKDPSTGSLPNAITVGSDGALWFTQPGINSIESITTAGAFQHETALSFPGLPNPTPTPGAITSGPNANASLWVTDANNPYIYQVNTNGTLGVAVALQYPDSSSNTLRPVIATGITSGGTAGGVWFTGYFNAASSGTVGVIGRIDPTNPTAAPQIIAIPQIIPGNNSQLPLGIVGDPADSNAFWFLDQIRVGGVTSPIGLIGRITSAGQFTLPAGCQVYTATQVECVLSDPSTQLFVNALTLSAYPGDPTTFPGPPLAVGSDGAIWYATNGETAANASSPTRVFGRITTDGATQTYYPDASQYNSFPLALGSDGAIWEADAQSGTPGNIDRVNTSGIDTAFVIPAPASGLAPRLTGVTAGPDGALWFTDNQNGSIVQVFPSLALNCGSTTGNLTPNTPVNFTCVALGGKPSGAVPAYSYTLSGTLSPGLTSVQNADGTFTVSGTPTGAGSFTIGATDSSTPPQQASQSFTVAAQTLQFLCSVPTSSATAGSSYTNSCNIAGGVPPYTAGVTSGTVPPGLTGTVTYNSLATPPYTYNVSGTVNVNASGTDTFTVVITDQAGNMSAPQTLTVTVVPAAVSLACNSNAQAVIGQAFQLSCFGFRGTPPYTFSATGLPAGLTINSTTGVISGTATSAGQSAVTVTLTDSTGATSTVTQSLTLNVVSQPLSIVCDFSPLAQVNVPYSATCTPAGGTPPYTYAPSGTPPPSFALNGNVIAGTPATPGLYSFALTVLDAAGGSAKQNINLFVHPTALTILTTTLPAPNVSLPYAVTPIVEGGTPPYTFSLAANTTLTGTGLTLNPTTGTISGAAVAGAFSLTLQVTDSAGATATQAYSGIVSATPLNVSTASFTLAPSVNLGGVNGLVSGPDGNLWFTTLDQVGGDLIGNISPSGAPVNVTLASNALTAAANAVGGDITLGPDGQLWIAQRDGNAVASQSTTLTSPSLSYLPSAGANPSQIIAGLDGALWFTEATGNRVAHIDSAGHLVELPIATAASQPAGIALASDGSIWFTEQAANQIGYVSEDGATRHEYPIPTAASQPTSIVLGPDNALWFTESAKGQIGRIDAAGNVTEYSTGNANSNPQAITAAPDGALYFTDRGANKIGRITVAGVAGAVAAPDANSGLAGITVGPDGNIWFAESSLSKIGRLSLVSSLSVTCTLPATSFPAQSALSGACTATGGTPPYTFAFDTASTPPPGATIDASAGTLGGTLTTAGTFTFDVLAKDSSSPALLAKSSSYTVTIQPQPLSATCTTPAAFWYTAYSGGSCSGVNGTAPYTYALLSGSLPPGLSLNPSTGVITGSPTAVGTFTFAVQVTDSSNPAMVASFTTGSITVGYGSVTSNNGALFTLSTVPATVIPGSNLSGITLTVNAPLTQPLSGTATLTFTLGSTSSATTPAGYVDPAMQFVDSSGNPLGTTYNFTFQPGTSTITLPAINPGTVTGQVNLLVSTTLPQVGASVTIPGSPSYIEGGSVQFTNITANSFDVEFVATEPLRAAQNATITFNPASGSQILGQQTFNFDVSSVSDQWFASAGGLQYGGRFSLTFPFQLSGPITAIGSVTVSLDSSSPVTGNR